MDVEQLEAFVAVADLRRLDPAARRLTKSASSVSRAIANLEQELGVELFVRARAGFTPTAVAKSLLPIAHQLLHAHYDLLASAKETTWPLKRPLTISCAKAVPPMVMEALLAELRQCSDFDVQFRPMARSSAQLADDVAESRVDLAAVHLPIAAAGLRSRLLLSYDHVVALAADHPLAGRPSLHAADLVGETIGLSWAESHPAAAEPYRQRLEALGIKVTPTAGDDIFRLAFAIQFENQVAVVRHPRYGGPAAMFKESGISLVPTVDPSLLGLRLGLVWRRTLPETEGFATSLDGAAEALGGL